MDGTLFQPIQEERNGTIARSLWTVIASKISSEALERQRTLHQTWSNGGFHSATEWTQKTLNMHAEEGITQDIFEEALATAEYRNGVKETFQQLNDAGVTTAIITGGFKEQAEQAQRELDIDHIISACEYYWADDGSLEGWNTIPTGTRQKETFARIFAEEHNTSLKHCSFVGDGKNDVWIADQVGTSIAYDAVPELKEASDYIFSTDNGHTFDDILPIIIPQTIN